MSSGEMPPMTRAEMARALVEKIEEAGVKAGVRSVSSVGFATEDGAYLTEDHAIPWLLFGNGCAAIKALFPGTGTGDAYDPAAKLVAQIALSADPLAEACRLVGIEP